MVLGPERGRLEVWVRGVQGGGQAGVGASQGREDCLQAPGTQLLKKLPGVVPARLAGAQKGR